MTLVHPLSLDRAAVRSLVADSIEASDAAELAALAGPLESLRKAHPGELSVAICVALEALASKDGADARVARTTCSACREDAA